MIRDPWDLVIALTIGVVLGWIATGCGPAVCQVAATRCAGQRAEVCDGRGQWSLVGDCAEAGAVCAEVADEYHGAGHACVPEEP